MEKLYLLAGAQYCNCQSRWVHSRHNKHRKMINSREVVRQLCLKDLLLETHTQYGPFPRFTFH